MNQKQVLYFDDSSDYSDSDNESEHGISGGLRPSQWLQSGNNSASYEDGLGGGKLKVAKNLKRGAKIVAKEVYKQAKPIVIAEGKKALHQGLQHMLLTEHSGAEVVKRGRGRPKKIMTEEDDHLGHIVENAYLKQGGNLRLGKKSKKLTDDLIRHGVQSGIEYAQSGGKVKFGKVLKKVEKSPVTKEVVHLGVRTGLAYATDGLSEVGRVGYQAGQQEGGKKIRVGKIIRKVAKNTIVRQVGNELLQQGVGAGLAYAIGGQSACRKIGGGSKRGEIVKQVMKEQGLSLPQASKFVKENNLY
jgi:hypothetical protein